MLSPKNVIFYYHGHFDLNCLTLIAEYVEKTFQCTVHIIPFQINIDDYYSDDRRQYNANEILKNINSLNPDSNTKKLGLLQVDLFIPILTFIFGQAAFQGNSGLVSIHRLKNELYGLEPDQTLLKKRLQKVILHELGHMYGLTHCNYPSCVMRSSTYVEDIDQKKGLFCKTCVAQLDSVLGEQ